MFPLTLADTFAPVQSVSKMLQVFRSLLLTRFLMMSFPLVLSQYPFG